MPPTCEEIIEEFESYLCANNPEHRYISKWIRLVAVDRLLVPVPEQNKLTGDWFWDYRAF